MTTRYFSINEITALRLQRNAALDMLRAAACLDLAFDNNWHQTRANRIWAQFYQQESASMYRRARVLLGIESDSPIQHHSV